MNDYCSGQRHITLDKQLSSDKQWTVLHLLGDKDLSVRLEELRRLFLCAVEQHDDEYAETCFGWLMKAVDDLYLSAFLEVTKRDTVLKGGDDLVRAGQALVRRRASLSEELWSDLPAKGVGKCYVHTDQDSGHMEDCDAPTLLETKKRILEEVARQWRDTKDEEEADRLFDLIKGANSQFNEERKMIEAVVREATGKGFSPIRLVRCYLNFADKVERHGSDLLNRIAQILAIGWARNSQTRDLAQIFGAVQPLLKKKRDSSYPEFACLRISAERLAELEIKVDALRQMLNPGKYSSKRKVRFRFLSPDAIEVVEVCQINHGHRDQNHLHDRFGELRDLVQGWSTKHPKIRTLVRLEVPRSFKEGEFFFEREQQLD